MMKTRDYFPPYLMGSRRTFKSGGFSAAFGKQRTKASYRD